MNAQRRLYRVRTIVDAVVYAEDPKHAKELARERIDDDDWALDDAEFETHAVDSLLSLDEPDDEPWGEDDGRTCREIFESEVALALPIGATS